MTEVVIGRTDWEVRGESGPIGVAEEGRDGTGIALIVPFWRNGVSRRRHQSFRRGCKRVAEDDEILDVPGVTGILGSSERARSP